MSVVSLGGVFAVIAALLAALMYGMASVLQQRAAAAQPADQSLKLGLLVRLVHNPVWVLGLACDVSGFAFQVVALAHGPLVVVQPLLVCGLLFALPLGAAWAGRRLTPFDWVGAVLVCSGLALFLVVANPARGEPDASWRVWFLLLTVDALVALSLIALGANRAARTRALCLSGAAGVIYGAAAALTKTTAHLVTSDAGRVLTHWEPYVLVVFGISGMVVGQSAFQAGALDVSLPTMTVSDPIVSVMIGVLAFGETISSSPAAIALQVLGFGAMTVGVFLLARHEAADARPFERAVEV
jgi:drug/metabolite transporter (DMT)-like permease